MGLIIFFILLIFILLIVLIIHLSKKDNGPIPYSDFEDDFDVSPENKFDSPKSSFPYPDPYDLPPEKAMFLDDDGEILDDL